MKNALQASDRAWGYRGEGAPGTKQGDGREAPIGKIWRAAPEFPTPRSDDVKPEARFSGLLSPVFRSE
jgi:hypothetical protein